MSLKQGGILSPKLFNIYVDDLSTVLNSSNIGCCFNDVIINHLYYADDLCLIAPSVHGINKLLSVCGKYAIDHDIVFNENKSVCLYYKPVNFKIMPVYNVQLNGVRIKFEQSCKYLGHVMSDTLYDDKDISRQLRSLYSRCNMMIRTFGACSTEVKSHLFMTYCGSMYTCHLWCKFTKRQFKKICVAYNNTFRRLHGYERYCSASGMFVENRVDTFDVRMRRHIWSFSERIKLSENRLVKTIVNSVAWSNSELLCQWERMLNVQE